MGNFAFDWWLVRDYLKEGIMAYITLKNGSGVKVSFVPVRREDDSNDIAPLHINSQKGAEVIETVRRLSRPFGTKFEIAENEVVVFV